MVITKCRLVFSLMIAEISGEWVAATISHDPNDLKLQGWCFYAILKWSLKLGPPFFGQIYELSITTGLTFYRMSFLDVIWAHLTDPKYIQKKRAQLV